MNWFGIGADSPSLPDTPEITLLLTMYFVAVSARLRLSGACFNFDRHYDSSVDPD